MYRIRSTLSPFGPGAGAAQTGVDRGLDLEHTMRGRDVGPTGLAEVGLPTSAGARGSVMVRDELDRAIESTLTRRWGLEDVWRRPWRRTAAGQASSEHAHRSAAGRAARAPAPGDVPGGVPRSVATATEAGPAPRPPGTRPRRPTRPGLDRARRESSGRRGEQLTPGAACIRQGQGWCLAGGSQRGVLSVDLLVGGL